MRANSNCLSTVINCLASFHMGSFNLLAFIRIVILIFVSLVLSSQDYTGLALSDFTKALVAGDLIHGERRRV